MRRGLLSPGHDDGEPGAVPPVMKALSLREDPASGLAVGGGPQRGRVRPGARRRFGHGEAGANPPRHERAQVALLLLRRAHHRQQVHIALVGRGAVHGQRPQRAVARRLQEQGRGREIGPAATELRGCLRSEHACRPRAVLQPDPERVIDAGDEGVLLQRDDHTGDEAADLLPEARSRAP